MITTSPDIVLTETPRGRFLVPKNDFIGQIFIDGEHFEDGFLSRILMLLNLVRDRDVVDVGAHFGCHTVPYSGRARATVHAFEPQSLAYSLLLKNIKINDCRNVTPYRIALGHEDGLVTTLGDKYELHNRIRSVNEPHSTHNYGGIGLGRGWEQVMMKTLDSCNLENVGLIKIDVEGAERLVLYGAASTIRNHKPFIVFEQHSAPRERIFEARWKEMCDMYSLPPSMRKTGIFDLIRVDFGYREIRQLDENNYLAIP